MNYLSLLYCLILIICGFGFPIAELTADSLENSYYQVSFPISLRLLLKFSNKDIVYFWICCSSAEIVIQWTNRHMTARVM